MLETVVENTNKHIDTVSVNYSDHDKYKVKRTTLSEMKACNGLLYMAGVFKSSRQNLDDLWANDETGMEIFRSTMRLQLFRFLLQCLRFDDRTTRAARSEVDKLAPIRQFVLTFCNKMMSHYSVGELVTIDEKLEKFIGKCPFRQYIASKPEKYGIKIYAFVDSKIFYTQNLEIYAGKQPEGPYQLSNSPADVVERISPISGSGRNVTVDNWFISVSLAMKLLKYHNLTILGTIRKNKKEIPPQLVQTNNKAINTTIFCFRKEMTMVSYVPKKGKVLLLVSTMHNDDKIDETTQQLRKPEIITTYSGQIVCYLRRFT
jgi:hypothetical protein